MRKLATGEKINEHGIAFDRQANGDGMFTVNVMVDGQRIHRVIGRESDGTTRTQAEEFIDKARQDAKAGRLNLPKGRKLPLTFKDAATQYLAKLVLENGKNIPMKESHLRLHLTPFFGDRPLAKISPFDLERYKKQRASEFVVHFNGPGRKPSTGDKVKPATINRELATASHLFSKSVEWGSLDHRPAKINRLDEDGGRIIYLTVEEAEKFLTVAASDQNIQLHPFIKIGLSTSMRLMEILSIQRGNINLKQLVIYIPQAKGGAREQPITADLGDYLATYVTTLKPSSPWLFPSAKAKGGHTVTLVKPFRRCVTAAGLQTKGVVRHTLRHTAITHLVQIGVDLPTVKRISGHKTLSMVERYSHQNGAHIQTAMDKLSERYKESAV